MALGKVYCFGPTFRAEKSKTRRHLAEFWMIEPEIAFADLDVLLHHAEALTLRIVTDLLAHHRDDLAAVGRDVAPLEKIQAPFPRLTYSDAVDLLRSDKIASWTRDQLDQDRERLQTWIANQRKLEAESAAAKKGWQQEKLDAELKELHENIRDLQEDLERRSEHLRNAQHFPWGRDFGGDEETILSRQFDRPVFVTEYPKKVKAFYMKANPRRAGTVLNVDMLAPEGYGEVIGGSVREENLDALEARMREEGMEAGPYQWYLDLRRYGTIPHGGFGLGIERTIAWMCGIRHIRETVPFPRFAGKMYP
jgi:asparaginyl-tRNA synthetase